MIRIHDFQRWPLWSILAMSFLTALIVFTGILPGIRLVLVLIFFVTCPGLPFIRLIRLQDFLTELVLMIAFSLVIDATVAMILLYTGAWSYVTGLLILIGISLTGVGLNLRQERLIAHNLEQDQLRKIRPAKIPVVYSQPGAPSKSTEKLFEAPQLARVELKDKPKEVHRELTNKVENPGTVVQKFETPTIGKQDGQPGQEIQPEAAVMPVRRSRRRTKKSPASEGASLARSVEPIANPENSSLIPPASEKTSPESQAELETQALEAKPAKTPRKTKKRSSSTTSPESASQMPDEAQANESQPVHRKHSKRNIAETPAQPSINEQVNPVEEPSIPEPERPARRKRSRKAKTEDQP